MPVKIFFCYAREDEKLLQKLEAQLMLLKRQNILDIWHDRDISAGTEWEREIDKNLNKAQIILLLISSDFIASDYCYSIEMKRAMERHELGEARVIPIILRPVQWQKSPFGKLQALPTDGKPVTSTDDWPSIDAALLNIAENIQAVIEELSVQAPSELGAILTPFSIQPPALSKITTNIDERCVPGYEKNSEFVLLGTIRLDAPVKQVTISPTEQIFLSTDSRAIKMWSFQTWDLLYTFENNSSYHHPYYCSAISSDDQILATGTGGGKIHIWNLQTKKPLHTLEGDLKDNISSIAISAYRPIVACAKRDAIELWNYNTGHLMHSFTLRNGYALARMACVAISPDGRTLVAVGRMPSGAGIIGVWNLRSGKLVHTNVDSEEYTCIAVSSDGRVFAMGTEEGNIRIFDALHWEDSLFLSLNTRCDSIILPPDGETVILGGADNIISVWNRREQCLLYTLEWHTGAVRSLAISLDGRMFISGSDDNTIKIWGKDSQ